MFEVFGNGYALIVGAGADLPTTESDARGLADVLRDSTRCAYPAEQVQVLTGKDATRAGMLAGLEWLRARVQTDPQATAIAAFSGHGIVRQAGYLLTFGWDLDNLSGTAISSIEFNERLRAIQAQKLLILLDCCHAGRMAEAKGLPLIKSPVPPGLFDELKSSSGRVVLASSRQDEVSYTANPYSVFTGALLESLAGYGAFENDGYARILDTALWVGRKVPERTNERQHPIIKVSGLEDNFALAYYAGGAKEPRRLEWTRPVPVISPELDTAQKDVWRRMLRNYQQNLLFIEERISHYVEFTAIPLQLIRSKWVVEGQITKLESKLGLCPRGGGP
jgi:uncharacterized caspase-like protein